MVDGRDDELRDAAYGKTGHEEDAPTADFGDDTAVNHDCEDTHGGQDTGVHKGTTDICHLSRC